MGKSQKEQLEVNLNTIRRLADVAQERLESHDGTAAFTLNRFNQMAKKLCNETVPQIEHLLGEVDRLETEAQTDRTIAATDRASAEHRLEGVVSIAKAINNPPSATEQFAAADAAVEAAIREKEEAIEHAKVVQTRLDMVTEQRERVYEQYEQVTRERDTANQLVQDLRTRNQGLEQDLLASRAENAALKSSASREARESRPVVRRSAAEAEFSSPEPGDRHVSKRVSLSSLAGQALGSIDAVSGAPLPTRGSRLPKPVSPRALSSPKRAGVSTRTSITGPAPVESGERSATPKAKVHYDWETSFNMLELPAEWDQEQRNAFMSVYSGIRNNLPDMQVDILARTCKESICLISRIERKVATLKGGISRSNCVNCSTKPERFCVYLEDISPDGDTKRYLVKTRS